MRYGPVPLVQPGRYFCLRHNDTADYWSASWQPVGKPLCAYESICRHGTAYIIISSKYSDKRGTESSPDQCGVRAARTR